MSTILQHRRGTTAQHATFTGAAGEVTIDSTKNTAVVHDGATAGGIPLAKEATVMPKSGGAFTGDITVPSINGGPLAGIRNRIINGDMRIAQRGVVAASTVLNTVGFGGADRFATSIIGTSVSAGNLTASALVGASSGFGQYVAGLTATSVVVNQLQRIESINCIDLNGKTITVSGKIYQDTGSTVNYTIKVNGATVKDNFTSVALVGSTTLNVPTATLTPFTYTLTLGASSASNGLSVEVSNTTAFTVTSKNIAISDIQLELGSVATPFEWRDYGDELRRCQRYLPTVYIGSLLGMVASSTLCYVPIPFNTVPRVSPTGIVTGTVSSMTTTLPNGAPSALTSCTYSAGGLSAGIIAVQVASGLTAGNASIFNTQGQTLYFTGCEL